MAKVKNEKLLIWPFLETVFLCVLCASVVEF